MAKSNFIVRGGADFSNIEKSLNKTQQQFNVFQGKIGKSMKLITSALGSLAVGKFVKDSTSAAMAVESSMDNISRNMGKHSAGFENWANTQSRALGMAREDAYKYGSTFSNLLSSFSSGTEQTANETQKLMQAAAVIASKTGRTYDDTANRIRSGMLGSTEAIEDLGIYTQVSMLESTEAFKKFANGKSWAQLGFQTQQQIRLNAILEQSYERYGDVLADTTQTRQSQFIASLKNIQLNLGQVFMPIYNSVLPALTSLADKLESITAKMAVFSQAIFGTSKAQAQAANEAAAAQMANGKAIEKAGKKAKGALSGFDQLNTLTQQTADATEEIADADAYDTAIAGTSQSSGVGLNIDDGKAQGVIENLKKGLSGIGKIMNTVFGPSIRDAIEKLNPAMDKLKQSFAGIFSGAENHAQPLINLFTNNIIPAARQVIDTLSTMIAGLLDSLAPVISDLSEALGKVFAGLLDNGLPAFYDFARGVWEVLESLFGYVKIVFDSIWRDVVQPAMDIVAKIIVDVLESIKKFWDEWGGKIVSGAKEAINNVSNLFQKWWETIFKPIWDRIVETIKWLWDNHLKGLVDEFLKFVGKLVDGALEIYNKFIVPLVSWFIDKFGPSISNAFQFVVDVLGTVIATVSDVVKGILKSLGGVIDFIVGIFTGDWDKAWTGIKDLFIGIWDAIVGVVKRAVNLIIDAVNWMVRGLNKIKIDIPDWISERFGLGKGATFGFKIKEIPKLADGGLAYGSTLAMVGDNLGASADPEVISPLSKLQDIMGGSNQAVVDALTQILGEIRRNNGDIILKMGENELGRAAIRGINAYQRTTGKTLLMI